MSKNKATFRKPVLATEMRLPGRDERMVGAGGELNASSKQDLMRTVASLMEQARYQDIHTEAEQARRKEEAKLKGDLLFAAFSDPKGVAHRELGNVMANDLYIAANRDGFARRFLANQALAQGQLPRVKMRSKGVTAVVATSPSRVETQITNDAVFLPPEFDIVARPFVPKREIDQSMSDVVDEKFVEGTEALMVAEDRIFRALADKTVGLDNPLTNIVGSFTPQALNIVRSHVTAFNIPARYLLIASDLWVDITSDPQWTSNALDPVSQHEVLLTGQIGTLYGMAIISDAFRHPQHKVLDRGEFYVIGDAINLGIMTDRNGIDSEPTTQSNEHVAGRGWIMTESLSMTIANSRAIAKGIR